jgi:2-polyprenyl-3-methyl-5-hydroxy-6-metoxy-1,4-benzoquinol methylase
MTCERCVVWFSESDYTEQFQEAEMSEQLTSIYEEQRDAMVGRLLNSVIGSLELLHVYLGDRLGLYRALADGGRLTPAELATTAGVHQRYTREWLEEQAVSGFLTVESDGEGAEARRYSLPPAYAEVLIDADNLNYMSPTARQVVAVAGVMPRLLDAFKTGDGIPFEAYGADMCTGIADSNRVMFINLLGSKWLPAIPDVDRRLREQPPARVADVGCGTGNSSIALASAYPLVRVEGIDLDQASIDEAREKARAAGVDDRVSFQVGDARDPSLAGSFDLVVAFETIHDMTDPVGALRAMRNLAAEGGAVLVVDERVAEEFTAPGDDVDRLMYGFSAVHCLAAAMGHPRSAMTGTVMRPSTLRRYAREAGFDRVEILPIENEVWRFYRLS